jgi:hypothetical protein
MKDLTRTIEQALALGLTVKVNKEIGQVKIEVSKGKVSVAQMIPFDDHINYAFAGCIEFCANELLKLL